MAQVGLKGPFEIPYQEGTWAPVAVGLTVVGGVTIFGRYRVIGTICFFDIDIVPDGMGGTTAATAGVTYFHALPIPTGYDGLCSAGQCMFGGSHLGYGVGVMAFGLLGEGEAVFPPSWAATDLNVFIHGWYMVG